MRGRLFEYVNGMLRAERSQLLLGGGVADHVHCLVRLHQGLSVADALRLINANSSKWIRKTFERQRNFAWQSGYGAFSVSQSSLAKVEAYIRVQAEHHRTISFQEEFLAFLQRHQIPYNEQYLWD